MTRISYTCSAGHHGTSRFVASARAFQELNVDDGREQTQTSLLKAIRRYAVVHDVHETLRAALAATKWGADLAASFYPVGYL